MLKYLGTLELQLGGLYTTQFSILVEGENKNTFFPECAEDGSFLSIWLLGFLRKEVKSPSHNHKMPGHRAGGSFVTPPTLNNTTPQPTLSGLPTGACKAFP